MVEPTIITLATVGAGEASAVAASTLPASPAVPASAPAPTPSRPSNPDKLYLPAPIRTFPLPAFYPTNPISLLHLAYAWLNQVFFPPAAEPSAVHIGVWDPDTRSVHINDPQAIRTLWEQGFFGKGSLSRSEPNWLKRELSRRGASKAGKFSEECTESRREARRLAKWERAKAELEALEQQRLEEAGVRSEPTEDAVVAAAPKPPVGPSESLAASNSLVETIPRTALTSNSREPKPPVGPTELLALPNSLGGSIRGSGLDALGEHIATTPATFPPPNGQASDKLANGHAQPTHLGNDVNGDAPVASALTHGGLGPGNTHTNGLVVTPMNGTVNEFTSPTPSVGSTNGSSEPTPPKDKQPQPLKRRKSVRFSPTVESTTFQHHDPPNPRHPTASPPKAAASAVTNGVVTPFPSSEPVSQVSVPNSALESATITGEVQNKEHYQLAPVEAFFLVFALGALSIVDPVTLAPIPTEELLTLFRSYSYFPPLNVGSPPITLQPQDPVLVDYAVYHHFRSLGWVPRHGIKFGVDLLLYERGPPYNHSHFGAIIMPSFSDERWKEAEYERPKRTWSWLMGINRVLAHVLKGLVLVYVDIPPPSVFDQAMQKGGLSAALKKYKIREVMVRRFSVNRNR